MLTVPSHLLICHMFNHGFQVDLLQHFHRDQSKGDQPFLGGEIWVIPQILLLFSSFMKTVVIFAFFQSLETFPNQSLQTFPSLWKVCNLYKPSLMTLKRFLKPNLLGWQLCHMDTQCKSLSLRKASPPKKLYTHI